MDKITYNDIITTIRRFSGLSRDCADLLCKKFPSIPEFTLQSILSLEYQRFLKGNTKYEDAKEEIFKSYQEKIKSREKPGIISRLSLEYQITPSLAARLILSAKYKEEIDNENKLIYEVNNHRKDTSLITDPQLAYEIFLTNLYDDQFSPFVDAMRISLGQEYEIKIYKWMTSLGLAFRDEDSLRIDRSDKTPDFKLDVPVLIDGFIIHWIESKALFADVKAHNEYIINQYQCYINRFGPGVVIYWGGYVQGLRSIPKLLVRDSLPCHVHQLYK